MHRLVWAWRYTIPAASSHGALAELDGETVRVLASSLTEVEDARRVECADAPLWLVKTEPVPPPTRPARLERELAHALSCTMKSVLDDEPARAEHR